jgi:hypothetical protein
MLKYLLKDAKPGAQKPKGSFYGATIMGVFMLTFCVWVEMDLIADIAREIEAVIYSPEIAMATGGSVFITLFPLAYIIAYYWRGRGGFKFKVWVSRTFVSLCFLIAIGIYALDQYRFHANGYVQCEAHPLLEKERQQSKMYDIIDDQVWARDHSCSPAVPFYQHLLNR